MLYKIIALNPALQKFVKNYLIAHFTFDEDLNIPFLPYSPEPEQTNTFQPEGKLTISNPVSNAI